jgi:outer membrane biosynthesis protein TonB
VIGWGLVTFTSKAFESIEAEAIPVEFVTDDQLAKAAAGIKTGKKENPKLLVEKLAEAKPNDDAVGKITEKKAVVTDAAPEPTKPPDKPAEKKPDSKPAVENKPKEEIKPADKRPDPPKVDSIAETLKKEEAKKPQPKPQTAAAAPPPQVKKREYKFDTETISKLVDKRDPSRQAVTGDTLNSNAALGLAKGKSADNSATWKSAFIGAVRRCFNFPYNGQDADQFEVDIDIYLQFDGTVASEPVIAQVRGPSRSVGNAMAESAKRAVKQCQAYAFLPKEQYETWKFIPMTFGLKDLL